jgi:hypothetical protein
VDVRNLALRAYWGGRCEAYVRGLYVGPVVELDAVSLYPHAAILQPLPHERTHWSRVTSIEEVQRMEGFARVTFGFPSGCAYPCLPSVRDDKHCLMFPRSGGSACTFSELRAALQMGVTLEIIEAHGFEPGGREREHDLARYMRHFIKAKSEADKDSLDYVTNKLLLNALVGKFAERVEPDLVVRLERHGRESGSPGLGHIVARDHQLRAALRGAPQLGSAWAPEWAALILGRARAIMASIIARGGALLVSTDAVVVQRGVDIDCDGLRELRSVGSDMIEEASGDGILIARARLYAMLSSATPSDSRPALARDEEWAVTKIARHGIPGDKAEAAEDILACLREARDVAPVRTRKRLLGASAAAREGRAVNDEVSEPRQAKYGRDGKRPLQNRDVNLFAGFSRTAPFASLARANLRPYSDEQLRVRRRRSRLSATKLASAIARREAGESLREIEKSTGISKSTLHRLSQKLAPSVVNTSVWKHHVEPYRVLGGERRVGVHPENPETRPPPSSEFPSTVAEDSGRVREDVLAALAQLGAEGGSESRIRSTVQTMRGTSGKTDARMIRKALADLKSMARVAVGPAPARKAPTYRLLDPPGGVDGGASSRGCTNPPPPPPDDGCALAVETPK